MPHTQSQFIYLLFFFFALICVDRSGVEYYTVEYIQSLFPHVERERESREKNYIFVRDRLLAYSATEDERELRCLMLYVMDVHMYDSEW